MTHSGKLVAAKRKLAFTVNDICFLYPTSRPCSVVISFPSASYIFSEYPLAERVTVAITFVSPPISNFSCASLVLPISCAASVTLIVILCLPASPLTTSLSSPFTSNLHQMAAVELSCQVILASKVSTFVSSALQEMACSSGNTGVVAPSSLSSEQLVNDTINIIANAMIQLIPFKFNVLIIVWF